MPEAPAMTQPNIARARMVLAEEELARWRTFHATMIAAAEKALQTKVPVGADGIMLLGCRIILEPPPPWAAPPPSAETVSPETDAPA